MLMQNGTSIVSRIGNLIMAGIENFDFNWIESSDYLSFRLGLILLYYQFDTIYKFKLLDFLIF